MPEERHGALRLHGYTDHTVRQISQFLLATVEAYESIAVFEILLDRFSRYESRLRRYDMAPFFHVTHGFFLDATSLPSASEMRDYLAPQDRLRFQAAQFSSPGFWEFFGKLNPLEVIRLYLNDRHERRKDRDYREGAEQDRMMLENALRENQVIRERIQMAKELGASDEDLMPLINPLVFRPLQAIGRYQDGGLIAQAEMIDVPKLKAEGS